MGRWGGRDSPFKKAKDGGEGSGPKSGGGENSNSSKSSKQSLSGPNAKSLEGREIKATGKLGRLPRGSFERV